MQRLRIAGVTPAAVWQGEAPDLGAQVAGQPVEILREARQQIHLGDNQIDRKTNTQRLPQFRQPRTQGRTGSQPFRRGLRSQIRHVQRQDHAVERCAGAVFTQQSQKPVPLPGVALGRADFATVIVTGIAPGGVNKHCFVGKPPVAVQRAAARHGEDMRGLLHLLRQRKLQSGVEQCCGFTVAGATDNHEPRQFVQKTFSFQYLTPARQVYAQLFQLPNSASNNMADGAQVGFNFPCHRYVFPTRMQETA